MYKVRYHYRKEIEWERENRDMTYINNRESTIIEARFRFRGEYSPCNEENVMKRVNPSFMQPDRSKLGVYLSNAEKLRLSSKLGEGFRLGSFGTRIPTKGTLEFPFFQREPGFSLKLEVPGKMVGLDEIINLNELNRFILTGEVPERIKDSPWIRPYLLPDANVA